MGSITYQLRFLENEFITMHTLPTRLQSQDYISNFTSNSTITEIESNLHNNSTLTGERSVHLAFICCKCLCANLNAVDVMETERFVR